METEDLRLEDQDEEDRGNLLSGPVHSRSFKNSNWKFFRACQVPMYAPGEALKICSYYDHSCSQRILKTKHALLSV